MLCPACADETAAEDAKTPYRCTRGDAPTPGGRSVDPCGWTGTFADTDDGTACPMCGAEAEPADALIVEPTAPEAGTKTVEVERKRLKLNTTGGAQAVTLTASAWPTAPVPHRPPRHAAASG